MSGLLRYFLFRVQNRTMFRNLNHYEHHCVKRKVFRQLWPWYLAIYFIACRFDSPKVKQKFVSSTENFVHEDDVRLTILRNLKILRKRQNAVVAQLIVQSFFPKQISGNSRQNLRKSRYNSLLVLPIFAYFTLSQMHFSGICVETDFCC